MIESLSKESALTGLAYQEYMYLFTMNPDLFIKPKKMDEYNKFVRKYFFQE